MTIFNVITAFGGLAMFLYGMTNMGTSLEKLAGGKLESTLQSFTSNIFKCVLLGAVITAAIQSSSATTVIVVGLVNSGVLKLYQAAGVIMGANIGTTITAQILRLGDIDSSNIMLQLMKPKNFAPVLAVVGIVILMVSNRNKFKNIGQILINFGLLFIGMYTMEGAFLVLRDSPAFVDAFASVSNPLIGIAIGAGVTAIIQSSSASVGILQAMTVTGQIRFSGMVPIILGQNIGTCVTALISSIGAKKNARRAAMIHLFFNIIGTGVFLIVIYSIQAFMGFSFWDNIVGRGDIANFHTLFNISSTLLLLPFTKYLVKLANRVIRIQDDEIIDEDEVVLDERLIASPALALQQSKEAVLVMARYAHKNFLRSAKLLSKYDKGLVKKINKSEDNIDKLEGKLGNYLVKLTDKELNDADNTVLTQLLHMVGDWERVGDCAINIMDRAEEKFDKEIEFSKSAVRELEIITAAIDEILTLTIDAVENNDIDKALRVEPLEENIDVMRDILKQRHIKRLKKGKCKIETGIIFLEIISNYESIGDHCSTLALYVIESLEGGVEIDFHKYLKEMHSGSNEFYNEVFNNYQNQYTLQLEKKAK